MTKISRSVSVFLLFVLIPGILGSAISADKIIKKVQKKFDSIDSFSADLKETFHWALADETQSFEGKIYLQKADKFRLESEEEIIISDGKTLWRYSAINKQVIIENLRKTEETLLPRDLLFKYSKDYQAQLISRKKTARGKFYILELFPKSEEEFIKRMEIWVDEDDWLVKRVEYLDINENKTIYEISNIKTDLKLEDALFQFEIPNGVEVVDMR